MKYKSKIKYSKIKGLIKLSINKANTNLMLNLWKNKEPKINPELQKIDNRTQIINWPGKRDIKYKKIIGQKTEWQNQFWAKQVIQSFYGNISIHSKFKSAELVNIEQRLDVLVFRLMFATSIYHARFLIKSGCIKVNDTKITSPHSFITPGSIIENLDKNAHKTFYIRKLHELDNIYPKPIYLHNLNYAKGVFVRAPLTSEIHLPFTHPSLVPKYNLFVNRPV